METKEVAVMEETAVNGFIDSAIKQKLPVETLERLFALREKALAAFAKREYDAAMAACQGDLPVIEKSKTARDENRGKDLYKYAPMDDMASQCGPIIAKHGFSYAFRTQTKPEGIAVTIIVKHSLGHSEEYTMETGLATKTNIMSGPQQIASTITFNKRYAFMNAFGITTGDEDTDAADVKGQEQSFNQDEWASALDEVTSLDGLRNTWARMPVQFKPALEARKEELKNKLTHGV